MFCFINSNLTLRICNVTQQPLSETQGSQKSAFSDTVLDVVKNMTVVPVTVLQITSISAFRSDAHVGDWNDKPSVSDCSHWCLPGVPDMWNEILLSYLFAYYGHPLLWLHKSKFYSFYQQFILSLILYMKLYAERSVKSKTTHEKSEIF